MSMQRIELPLKQAETGVRELRLKQTLDVCFLVDVYELVVLQDSRVKRRQAEKQDALHLQLNHATLNPLLLKACELDDILYSVGLDEVLCLRDGVAGRRAFIEFGPRMRRWEREM